jgi:hypothetical protein
VPMHGRWRSGGCLDLGLRERRRAAPECEGARQGGDEKEASRRGAWPWLRLAWRAEGALQRRHTWCSRWNLVLMEPAGRRPSQHGDRIATAPFPPPFAEHAAESLNRILTPVVLRVSR